jgi:epoxyqueuosine reductase
LINQFAEETRIEYGICDAFDFEYLRKEFENAAVNFAGFISSDTEKRIYPRLTLKDAQSIIVLAKGYYKQYSFKNDGKMRANISMGAIGNDYHSDMQALFSGIGSILTSFGAKYEAFSDTGPLCDRAAAKRSQVGYTGKNGCIVTSKNGSSVFLGYILTDLKLTNTIRRFNGCENCRKCISACPSGALSDSGFNFKKCISYLTQVKRVLSFEEMKSLNGELYGCDRCQRVCRGNGGSNETVTDIEICRPLIKDILKMSNREFKECFGNTAMGWRGANIIKRNAICALLKYKTKEASYLAQEMTFSQSRLLRQTAVRALILLGSENKDFLTDFIKREKDTDIINDCLNLEGKWGTGIREGCVATPLKSL